MTEHHDRVFVTHSIPEWNTATLAGRNARGQTESMVLIGTGNGEEAL